MKTSGGLGWWVLAVVCSASACGQELALPTADSGKTSVADAPVDGTTGASGAPAEAPPRARLPIADTPIFTEFGGAGGDETAGAGDAVATMSGSGGSGATSRGGSGGSAGHGGAGGSGGRASTGGSVGVSGAAGTKASAGAAGSGAGDAGSGGSGGAVTAGPPAILFSEYVEGSGSFKALEIYAMAASSLEGCELQTYFNGKLEPSRLALHGSLTQGRVQVLCSSALATTQPSLCDRSTSLTFNGDDALALSCGGVLLDVIGQIGVDPGDAWAAGATADHTLRRRCSVTVGRADGSQPFEPDAEWLLFGVDTFSDLGAHGCSE
jgi:hypothetical protein